ncbi:MAG: hypothetical protein RMK20_01760, partial [Verrucomicrobiales bacterium]|nr:hypothetical protein [Verrucomicrobiales bacterium]
QTLAHSIRLLTHQPFIPPLAFFIRCCFSSVGLFHPLVFLIRWSFSSVGLFDPLVFFIGGSFSSVGVISSVGPV